MSRQVRIWCALAAAVALVAAAVFSSPAASAEPVVDPALAHAQAQLQWCQNLRQFDARTSADRAWADTCIRLAQREVNRLTPPSPSPSTPPTSTPPPASPTPSPSPPAAGAWPTPATTGVPAFWQPVTVRATTLTVTTAGALVEDVELGNGANLIIAAPNVTVRRVRLVGGYINNQPGAACNNGLRLEQVTIGRATPMPESDQEGAVRYGGYSADRLKVDGWIEGPRISGRSAGCGPVTITNSWIRAQRPDTCVDWHGDAMQSYDGAGLTLRNVTLWLDRRDCGATSALFVPSGQNNGPVDADRLMVRGGGWSVVNGAGGRMTNVLFDSGTWAYGPIDIACSLLSEWSGQVVTIGADWQPATVVRTQPCNTT